MNEDLSYIDAYFQKELSEEERQKFELRCISDEGFATEVAFYVSSRAALRDVLLDEKKKIWASSNPAEATQSTPAPVKTLSFRKWAPYAAAACVVLALLAYPLFFKESPEKFAAKYIKNDLSAISQTMDASRDTLQLAIAAFNKRDYPTAGAMFEAYSNNHPDDLYALRYIGQTQLMRAEYDQAIKTFELLSAKKAYSNPGLFLKGIALLGRNQPGDQEAARLLFRKVTDEHLEGEAQARQWLDKWPN